MLTESLTSGHFLMEILIFEMKESNFYNMKLSTRIISTSIVVMMCCYEQINAQDNPNLIIIYTDDQGSVDFNSYGAKDLVRPNMDAWEMPEPLQIVKLEVSIPLLNSLIKCLNVLNSFKIWNK